MDSYDILPTSNQHTAPAAKWSTTSFLWWHFCFTRIFKLQFSSCQSKYVKLNVPYSSRQRHTIWKHTHTIVIPHLQLKHSGLNLPFFSNIMKWIIFHRLTDTTSDHDLLLDWAQPHSTYMERKVHLRLHSPKSLRTSLIFPDTPSNDAEFALLACSSYWRNSKWCHCSNSRL